MSGFFERLFARRWSDYYLLHIYLFEIQMYSVEVRNNLRDGRMHFRVKKIVYPCHQCYFDVDKVKAEIYENEAT